MKKTLTFLVFLLTAFQLNAQNRPCGTIFRSEDLAKMPNLTAAQLQAFSAARPTSVSEIVVQFNVMCSGNASTAPVSAADITSALAALNAKYAPVDMHFVECTPPKYFLNSSFYYFSYNDFLAEQQIGQLGAQNVLNIWVVKQIGVGTVAGYTHYSAHDVYVAGSTFNNTSTHFSDGLLLTHEVSHVFNIFHTCGMYGPGTTELVDGTNGTTDGDWVQDTPADPNYAQYTTNTGPSCNYPVFPFTGSPCSPPSPYPAFCDANSQVYTPSQTNLMFIQLCTNRTDLSTGQLNRALGQYQYAKLLNPLYFTGAADLYTKDGESDNGFIYNSNNDIWESPDIWNCRTSQTCLVHENPGYSDPTKYNYLRVRVRNAGCQPSGPVVVHAYWTLGSTGETWKSSWNGAQLCNQPAGNEIGTGIPITTAIPGQGEQIVTFKWQPINPSTYTCMQLKEYNGDPMICFLSRIVGSNGNEPMNYETDPMAIRYVVQSNNNNATRNTSLVNLPGNKLTRTNGSGGTIFVQNPLAAATAFDLKFMEKTPSSFFNHGSIIVRLSEDLWNSWTEAGQLSEGMQVLDAAAHEVLIRTNKAVFKNVTLETAIMYQVDIEYYLEAAESDEISTKFFFYQTLPAEDGVDNDELVGSGCQFNVTVNGAETNDDGGDSGSDAPAGRGVPGNTAANSHENNFSFAVSPTPASNELKVSIMASKGGRYEAGIYSLTGQKIQGLGFDTDVAPGTTEQTINTGSLANGIYFIKVKNEGSVRSTRFMINH